MSGFIGGVQVYHGLYPNFFMINRVSWVGISARLGRVDGDGPLGDRPIDSHPTPLTG